MPSPIASLSPPTAPVPHGAGEHEPIDSGTLSFNELWGDKARGLRFADLIDIVNPLQHIPVVSTIYRAITGDQLGLGARLIGGALYGGGFGFAIAAMQAAAEEANGKDVGASLLAFVTGRGGGETPGEDARVATAADPMPEPGPADPPADPPAAVAMPAAVPAPPPPAEAEADKAPSPLPAADRMAARDDGAGGRGAFPAHPPHVVTPSQNERIMAAVEHARRAQAGMLLASLAGETPPAARARKPEAKDTDTEPRAAPARPEPVTPPATTTPRLPAATRVAPPAHPNALPAGASPEWIGAAMERALGKYEETLRLRGR